MNDIARGGRSRKGQKYEEEQQDMKLSLYFVDAVDLPLRRLNHVRTSSPNCRDSACM